MPARPFVLTERDHARPYEVLGMQVSVLLAGERTGSYEVLLLAGEQGSGLPAHRHSWEESIYVIKGEVEFGLGEEVTWGAPGTVIHFPAGTIHAYRFGQAGAIMVSISSRPGAARLFAELDREPAPAGTALARLKEIGARYGLTVVG